MPKSLLQKTTIGAGALLLALSLSVGCRGRGAVSSDKDEAGGIEGFPVSAATVAFYGFAEGKNIDIINNDETPDTQAIVTIVLSDRKTICKDFGNLSFAQDEDRISDMTLVVINAHLIESGGDRSPLNQNDIIVHNEQDDKVDARFKARADGATQTTAQTTDRADDLDTNNDVELHLLGVGGDRVAGTIVAPMTFFDDTLGRDNTALISGYFAARHCRALDAFALAGGL